MYTFDERRLRPAGRDSVRELQNRGSAGYICHWVGRTMRRPPTFPQVELTGSPMSVIIGFRRPMHAFLSNLTASLLLIHAVLGCCWHHGHDCATCDGTAIPAAWLTPCCKHHQDACDERQEPAPPYKCQQECSGTCTYLPPQKTQLDCSDIALPFDFAVLIPAMVDAQTASAIPWERASDSGGVQSSVRRHLLHQVLLI